MWYSESIHVELRCFGWINEFFSIFHIHPLYCIDDDHFHCKLQIGFHPSIRIRVISFRFLLFAATIVQTLVCNRSLLEILYMFNTHQQISMEDVVLYETNREALSALCSVVKHAGSGHSTKVLGETLDYVSCFPPTSWVHQNTDKHPSKCGSSSTKHKELRTKNTSNNNKQSPSRCVAPKPFAGKPDQSWRF